MGNSETKKRTSPAPARPARPSVDPGEAIAREHGLQRSPEWPEVEKAHLAKEPRCVVCGKKARPGQAVQVHHVFAFHVCVLLGRPDLELDQRNLITLCQSERGRPEEDHHLLVGHLDDFESMNLDVRRDAEGAFRGMSAEEIRGSAKWKARVEKQVEEDWGDECGGEEEAERGDG